MSRLIDLGPGELTDRLTILSLKLLFGQQTGKDCTHWLHERAKLLPQLRSKTLNGTWFEYALDLAAVNAALWHAEDDLRNLRTSEGKEINWTAAGVLGLRIQELNDRRAALVAKINDLTGEKAGAEKLT